MAILKGVDLSGLEPKARRIVEILIDAQDGLSDGYGYYTPYVYGEKYEYPQSTVIHLADIAKEIVGALEELGQ